MAVYFAWYLGSVLKKQGTLSRSRVTAAALGLCSLVVLWYLSARGTQRRKPTSADQVGTGDDKTLENMVAVRQSTRRGAPGSKEDAQHG